MRAAYARKAGGSKQYVVRSRKSESRNELGLAEREGILPHLPMHFVCPNTVRGRGFFTFRLSRGNEWRGGLPMTVRVA